MTPDHFLPNTLGRPGFAADRDPVLRIRPGTGETIGFETTDAVYAELDQHHDMAQLQAPINPVTGPVYVEGAEPGDTLTVTIHAIELTTHGWSVSLPGSGALQHRMGDRVVTRRCPIADGMVHVTDRHAFPVRPMIGCIGTAPAQGENSTIMPAYPEGGNMDVTEARPGSTVSLPVRVPGALLSVGDIHALMAEGESSFVAIEAQGTAIVSVDLVKGAPELRAPRIETEDAWLFVGLGDPVQESVRRGYEDAFDFLVERHGWSAEDAYAVLSAVGDSKLGGPTGSVAPDSLHPFTALGSVTLHRIPKAVL